MHSFNTALAIATGLSTGLVVGLLFLLVAGTPQDCEVTMPEEQKIEGDHRSFEEIRKEAA